MPEWIRALTRKARGKRIRPGSVQLPSAAAAPAMTINTSPVRSAGVSAATSRIAFGLICRTSAPCRM